MNQDQLTETNLLRWLYEITEQEYDGSLREFNQELNKLV
jgi:hypothetical protein